MKYGISLYCDRHAYGSTWVLDVWSKCTITKQMLLTRENMWSGNKPPVDVLYKMVRGAVSTHKLNFKRETKPFYGYY